MGGQQLTVQQGVAVHCCGNANGTTNVGKRGHDFTTGQGFPTFSTHRQLKPTSQ
jgi:hypothetical protein